MSDIPPLDQELKDVGIVHGGVDAQPLRHRAEVPKQVVLLPIVHKVGRHRDLLPHHGGEGLHRVVWVDLKELLHNLGVGRLVALFVGCNGAAYMGQLQVPVLLGVPRGVSVRYEGRPLLERCVNETLIGVALGFWILHKVRTAQQNCILSDATTCKKKQEK